MEKSIDTKVDEGCDVPTLTDRDEGFFFKDRFSCMSEKKQKENPVDGSEVGLHCILL